MAGGRVHVDFGQALVMGDAVAKKEEHHYYSPHVPIPTALHGVPAPPAGFTGRTDELDVLLKALDPAAHSPVTAVAGLGGVGKTALALHTAHAARERGWFPGGTLFIDLHGYDPVATTASQALQALLRALGTAPKRIPAAAELDNASSPQQVRPLLAGHPAHRTLITSRDVLPQIGAQQIRLRQLTPGASKDLLDHALRTADPYDRRITEDSTASEQLACTCGGLPLALQICAALLIADPEKPVAELAEELADSSRRIDHLDDGERSVRAVFDLSYRRLPQDQARLFRLLAISPGTEVTLNALSALAGAPDTPQRLLDALARTHLVERGTTRSHWRMHDLVRDYAQTVGECHESGSVP
ncbi:AAA family ATPase [Streptomyces sp. 21So2-11]|uniref:AAA family ATPase n=1 Tax=Streptomyces sp. 21So2-11 TaxID=3144408 RepID=UPI0032197209